MSSKKDSMRKVVKQDAKKTVSWIKSDTDSEEVDKPIERKKKPPLSTKSKRQQKDSDHETDGMQSLMNMSQFPDPIKKKIVQKPIKSKEIQIDLNNDSQEEIIRKLVLTVQGLKNELDEYKIYVDGTFCTSAVHNRTTDDLDKRLTDLRSRVDDLA
jgi:hypothetical protein